MVVFGVLEVENERAQTRLRVASPHPAPPRPASPRRPAPPRFAPPPRRAPPRSVPLVGYPSFGFDRNKQTILDSFAATGIH